MDADVLMQRFGATPMLLKALENTFLVRREANTTGGYNYEISHDTLLAPVSVARKARLTEAAARQHAAEEAAERERLREQAAERERQLEEERRKRRRASLIAFGGLALALLACGASVFAYMKQSEAKEALIKVESATIAVTRGLLERAKEDVYHLNYEKARTAVLEAASLGQQKTDVAYALMELAYFQAEAAQWDKAVPDALQVATLLGNKTAQQHIATLPSDTMQWREHLRMALRDCSASVFESLEKRYYPTMRPVPAGKFMMGGNLEYIFYVDGGESLQIDYGLFFPGENEPVFNNSLPIHEVALSAFNMSETEITFFQWNLYLTSEKGDSTIYEWAPDWGLDGDNPAVNISWIDAASYANWLSERHGKSPVYDIHFKNRVTHSDGSMSATAVSGESPIATMYPNTNGYQMPTEAQWEYAAKNAGRDTFEYAGGNDIDGVAWSAGTMEGNKGTQPVATKQPNALGLYDMSGNAWEWCFDYFQEAYPSEAQTNPTGPQDGYRRVCRGGSWGSDPQFCRTACRYGGSPRHMDRSKGLGFRLVLP